VFSFYFHFLKVLGSPDASRPAQPDILKNESKKKTPNSEEVGACDVLIK
jgi:hypothetical protein